MTLPLTDFEVATFLAGVGDPLPDGAPDDVRTIHDAARGRQAFLLEQCPTTATMEAESEAFRLGYGTLLGYSLHMGGRPLDLIDVMPDFLREHARAGWLSREGSQAQRKGLPFDPDQPAAWREGWSLAAELQDGAIKH